MFATQALMVALSLCRQTSMQARRSQITVHRYLSKSLCSSFHIQSRRMRTICPFPVDDDDDDCLAALSEALCLEWLHHHY